MVNFGSCARLCAQTLGPKGEGDGFRTVVLAVDEPPCLRQCPLLALVRFPLSRLVANLPSFTEICGVPKAKKKKKNKRICLNHWKGRDICRSFGFVSGLKKCGSENLGRDFVSAGGGDVCADDVSAVVILLDVNPYFWGTKTSTGFTFDQFFQHVKFSLSFLTAVSL